MQIAECLVRRANAAVQIAEHEQHRNGDQLVQSLSYGLTTLRDLLFRRIHEDVERKYGMDSMLLPVSPIKTESKAKAEIEVFQIAESTFEVKKSKFVSDPQWYLHWLTELRLGDITENERVQRRLERYLSASEDDRRLMFSNVLERTFPEARRAPMVLYRVFPPAVALATSIAFGDHLRAAELRNGQLTWLPSIQDCYECHGRALDNGEKCQVCGNPVWYYKWLTAAE